jgi:membrane associated rhomboid family serine protease
VSQPPDENKKGVVDRIVFFVADTLDALGLNGTRLRWKWNQKRIQLGESGMQAENLWRSARSKHKMCPSCRALVARGARTCEECGTPLANVRAPGIGRLIANVLPGAAAATSLILLANGFWFLMTMLAQMKGGAEGFGIFSHFSPRLLYDFGGGFSPAFLHGEWWRVVTPIFLHGGIIHFFFNSYVLLQLGPLVEELYGTARFWVIYLLCGITGSVASQLWSSTSPRPPVSIGASGAIMGLMGLLLVYGWRRGGASGEALKSAMMRYAIYIVVFSLVVSGIDHVNHAGGFACGALLALIVPSGPYRKPAEARAWEIAAIAGVLLVVYCFYKVAASAMA